MKYTATVYVDKEDLDRARRLLEIDDLESMSDEELKKLGASTDDNLPLLAAHFENDNWLILDVNSGGTNYFDDMWMEYPDGSSTVYDCSYEIPNEIEVYDRDDNVYVITIMEER